MGDRGIDAGIFIKLIKDGLQVRGLDRTGMSYKSVTECLEPSNKASNSIETGNIMIR